MATTFENMQDDVFSATGLDATGDLAAVKRALNAVARNVEYAHNWRHRLKDGYLSTVTPYATGTVTATNASATVTGSGTTFATFTAGAKKFALAYSSPWYYASRDSATQLTLTQSQTYAEDTATDSDFVLYADTYDLATDVLSLADDSFRLHTARPNGTLDWVPMSRLDRDHYIHGVTGRPQAWSEEPDYTAGTRRVRVYPIPDAVYRVRYSYWKKYTDMSGSSDECDVPEERRELVVWGAIEWCARVAGLSEVATRFGDMYRLGLAQAISKEKSLRPAARKYRRWDAATSGPAFFLNTDQLQ